MAMDTFMAYVGVCSSVDDAKADYDAVHDLHTKDGLIDAYDAAVIERKDNGKGDNNFIWFYAIFYAFIHIV